MSPQQRAARLVRRRPAETAGLSLAPLPVVAEAFGASSGVVALVGFLAGATPAAVTYLRRNGGIRGVLLKLYRGDE